MINLSWYSTYSLQGCLCGINLNWINLKWINLTQSLLPFHRLMNSSCYTAVSHGSTSVSTMHYNVHQFHLLFIQTLPQMDLPQASSLCQDASSTCQHASSACQHASSLGQHASSQCQHASSACQHASSLG